MDRSLGKHGCIRVKGWIMENHYCPAAWKSPTASQVRRSPLVRRRLGAIKLQTLSGAVMKALCPIELNIVGSERKNPRRGAWFLCVGLSRWCYESSYARCSSGEKVFREKSTLHENCLAFSPYKDDGHKSWSPPGDLNESFSVNLAGGFCNWEVVVTF